MAKGVKGSTPQDAPKRTSFNVRPSLINKAKYIAWKENKDMSTLVNEGLEEVIKKYEKKNGPIPVK